MIDTVPVVAVHGDETTPSIDVDPVARWFDDVSRGRWRPDFSRLASVRVPHDLARYRAGGGILAGGLGSRDLVEIVVAGLDEKDRTSVADTEGRLLLITPKGFRPHTWKPRPGRAALGSRRQLVRYAVVPEDASAGIVAHELAHLLLGWPDLDRRSGRRCLMGEGARTGATPSAALLLRAGWRNALPLDRFTSAQTISTGGDVVGVVGSIVAEWRDGRLLAWADGECPRLVLDMAADAESPVLGLLAPAVRRMDQTVRTVDPVVRRPSRSSWALRASESG